MGDMWDVMSGVDSLIGGRGTVDESKLGIDGMVAGRIYFRVFDHEHRSIQGDFGGSGYQQLDDVLRQYGHYAVLPGSICTLRPWDDQEIYQKDVAY